MLDHVRGLRPPRPPDHGRPLSHVALALVSPLALVACSGGDFHSSPAPADESFAGAILQGLPAARLDSPDGIVELATAGSAPNVFAIATIGMSAADTSGDPACPKRTDGPGTFRYAGGCVDKGGREWFGSVAVEGSDTTSKLHYDGFGWNQDIDCGGAKKDTTLRFTGTASYAPDGDGAAFDVDLRGEIGGVVESTCLAAHGGVAWQYDGTLVQSGVDADNDGQKDDSLWNGTGRVGATEVGVVEVTTKDELLSSATCANEAASGTTELVAGADTVVITYDGKTDCDPAGTVTYTLDGVDKGELEGIMCSVDRPSTGGGRGLQATLLACLAFAVRRRRRR